MRRVSALKFKYYTVRVALLAALLTSQPVGAITSTWNVHNASANNWSPGTWTAGMPGNSAGDVAVFTGQIAGGPDLSQTVAINVPVILGTLNFGVASGNANSFLFTTSGTGSLTFDNTGSGAVITEGNLTPGDTIACNFILADDLTINNSVAKTLTLSGIIDDRGVGQGLTVNNSAGGTVLLSAANTYSGNTTISAGTLKLSAAGSIANTPSITIASGATFDVSAVGMILTPDQDLEASATGTNTTGTITMGASQEIVLSDGGLNFTAYGGGTTPPLTVGGAGSLSVDGVPVNITVTGNPLAIGNYTLIGKSGGATVTGTPGAPTWAGGVGAVPGTSQSLSTSSGALVLSVVAAVGGPPVANDDAYSVSWNHDLTVSAGAGLLANDTGASLQAIKLTGPANGTLRSLNSDGSFSYSPAAGFVGTISFTYKANDGTNDSAPATATITVVDHAPVAVNDSYTVTNNSLTVPYGQDVLANDTDADGDPLTAQKLTDVAHGTLTLNANGSFTYTPYSTNFGSDSFTYQATDGLSNSAPASVTLLSQGAPATEYYVSPTGSDTNPGSAAAPFQTIGRARQQVRTLNTNMTGDITVYLRNGWYKLTSTLTFDAGDSGMNGHNVIYRTYPGEQAVISGGRAITGWTLFDSSKNIWKASAPGLSTRQLYVNCVRAVRAHSGKGLAGAVQTSSGFTTTDTTMQNWGNKTNIEFVFNGQDGGTRTAKWHERRVGVASITGTNIVMKSPGFANSKAGSSGQGITTPTDIENAYELLNQPGEWYLDQTAGVLYYIPKTGENLATAEVIAPVLETLVQGTGTLSSPLHNLQFYGITFAHATWLLPNGNYGFAEDQANYCDGSGWATGNVFFQRACNLRFERCIFKHLGIFGLELSGGCQSNVVVGCVFTDISGNAIKLGGTDDPMRSDVRLRELNNQVLDCYFHDLTCEYHGGCAIFAGYVANTLFSHNEFTNISYSAMSIGWGWGKNDSYMQSNQVTFNRVGNINQVMGDGGAIYTLNPMTNSVVYSNWFSGMPGGTVGGAIYPDQGSAYLEYHHNVLSSNARWLHIWTSSIHDLNVHDNYTDTGVLDNKGTDITLSNNTVVSGGNWPQAARNIMNVAGLEANYADIKNLVCACSPVNLPAVTNSGAQRLSATLATIQGTLISSAASAAVWAYWGPSDGGLNAAAWAHSLCLGVNSLPPPVICATNLYDLTSDTAYYYRFSATNAFGGAWAGSSQLIPPPFEFAASRLADGTLQFSATHLPNTSSCSLYSSTNLIQWTKLFTTNPAGDSFMYTDTQSALWPRRFFRVSSP
jgi:autotransporter-associated beta strand protein/VCBS repeat-containing protein